MSNIAPRDFSARDGRKFRVRSAATEDAADFIRITAAVLTEEQYLLTEVDEFTYTVAEEREWIRSYVEHPAWLLIAAETAGATIGILNFRSGARRRMAHTGVLGMLVAADWRSQGVGSAVMEVLIDWAQRHPVIEKISLAVFCDNARAIGLYRKFGFIQEGRRVREYRISDGRYKDDFLMSRLVK